jgi:hypothetical protein
MTLILLDAIWGFVLGYPDKITLIMATITSVVEIASLILVF